MAARPLVQHLARGEGRGHLPSLRPARASAGGEPPDPQEARLTKDHAWNAPEDEGFTRRFSAAEIAAMRRLAGDEERLGRQFFKLIGKMAKSAPFAEDALAAWWCLRDPATPRRVRFILLSAIAYFVLPIDAVPDLLPMLGFTDDAAVIAGAIAAVASSIRPEHRDKARETLQSL
jgi:uncharacterized membrane protein YkvA (DUF1232 family)